MKNILLVCNAGMSTSILVNAMEKAADKKGIEVSISAIPEVEVANKKDQADVILLGPQISFLKNKVETTVNHGIPVEVIDYMDYGMINGEAVLEKALKLIEG